MNDDLNTRLLGRKVAIETAPYDASANSTLGLSTYTRTGPTREIDSADNGDYVP